MRKTNFIFQILSLSAFTLVLAGCFNPFTASSADTGFASRIGPPTLSAIAITSNHSSIALGLSEQFVATGIYSDGSTTLLTSGVSWSVTNVTGAGSMNVSGLLTTMGGSAGTVTVHAISQTVSGSADFTIDPPAIVSMTISPSAATLARGLTQQFSATGTLTDNSIQDVTSRVTWTRTNGTGSATIDSTGLLSAVGGSVGTVSVTATSGSVSAQVSISIVAATLVSIAVTPAAPSIALGLSQQFIATGTYTDASTQVITSSVTWGRINVSGTASINATGLVTTLGGSPGSVTVTATLGSISGNTSLTIGAATLVSIAVTPASASVALGLTQQFVATGTYTDNSTSAVTGTATWSRTNGTGSATINSSGLLSSLGGAQGSVTVTAAIGAVSGSTTFTLTAPTLVSIALTPTAASVALGSTQAFTATGTYTDNSTQDLTSVSTWSRINATGTATIDSSTGIADTAGGSQGTVTIRATSGGVTSTDATLTVLPLAASDSITAGTTSTSAAVSWTMPSGSVASGYLLVRSAGSSVSFTPTNGVVYSGAVSGGTAIYDGSTASYTDSGLTGGTQYTYAVFAYDAARNYAPKRSGTFVIGCDNLVGNPTFAGAGSVGDPYLICNASQLVAVGSNLSSNFLMVADIDMASYDGGSMATTFSGFGSYNNGTATGTPFTGVFDGGNHTISNMLIDQHSTGNYAAGLFNYTNGAVLKNLTLSSANVTGQNVVGILVGYSSNTDITDINVSGTSNGYALTSTTTAGNIGGVIGRVVVSGAGATKTYSHINSSATVNGRDTVGGIASWIQVSTGATVNISYTVNSGSINTLPSTYGNTVGGAWAYISGNGGTINISDSSNSGNVAGTGSWNGGFTSTIATTASGGTITIARCSNTGSVTTTGATGPANSNGNFNGQCLGGFFGTAGGGTGATISITQSYSTGNVTFASNLSASGFGGFFGCINPGTSAGSTITNSYSTGSVSVSSALVTKIGGFGGLTANPSGPGVRSVISDAYATGSVTATLSDYVGGFLGENGSTVSRTYASAVVSGKALPSRVGGLYGNVLALGTTTSSYWNSTIATTSSGVGNGSATGVTSLTTANFAIQGNFSGWDFATVWNDPSVTGFPTLR
jgi:hypothetical protein